MSKFKHNENKDLYNKLTSESGCPMRVLVCICCSHEWQIVKDDNKPDWKNDETICQECGHQGHEISETNKKPVDIPDNPDKLKIVGEYPCVICGESTTGRLCGWPICIDCYANEDPEDISSQLKRRVYEK